MPFRGTGRHGGILLTEGMKDGIAKRLAKLTPSGESTWKLVRNAEAEAFLASKKLSDGTGMRAAFDARNGIMYLGSEATYFDYFHEMAHATQRAELGYEAYVQLKRYDREYHVFSIIAENENKFTKAEIDQALDDMAYYESKYGPKTLEYMLNL